MKRCTTNTLKYIKKVVHKKLYSNLKRLEFRREKMKSLMLIKIIYKWCGLLHNVWVISRFLTNSKKIKIIHFY